MSYAHGPKQLLTVSTCDILVYCVPAVLDTRDHCVVLQNIVIAVEHHTPESHVTYCGLW